MMDSLLLKRRAVLPSRKDREGRRIGSDEENRRDPTEGKGRGSQYLL
jgi:hypothetical protein